MMEKHFKKIIFVLLLLLAIKNIKLKDIVVNLKLIENKYIFLVAFLQLITLLLTSYQWFLVMKNLNIRTKYTTSLLINSSGNVIDFITPGVKIGGDYHRLKEIERRLSIGRREGIYVLTIQKLISFLSFSFFFILSFSWIIKNQIKINFFKLNLKVLALLVLILILISIKVIKSYNEKLKEIYREVIESFKLIKNKKIYFFFNLIIGLIIWILYPFKLYILINYTY